MTSSGEVTGRRFLVQIKATSRPDIATIKIKSALCRYFRQVAPPVLLVLYRSVEGDLRLSWFHELDQTFPEKRQSVSFRLAAPPPDVPLGEYLEQGLQEYEAWHRDDLNLPITFKLSFESEAILDVPAPELARWFDAAAGSVRGLLVFGRATHGAAVSIGPKRTAVSLGRVASIDIPTGGRDGRIEAVVSDTFLAIALVLDKLGRRDLAGRLTVAFAGRSTLIHDPFIAVQLQGGLIAGHRIREALALAELLAKSASVGAWFLEVGLLIKRYNLSPTERRLYLKFLKRQARRADTSGDTFLVTHSHVALAEELRRNGKDRLALSHYRRAFAASPHNASVAAGIARVLLARKRIGAALEWFARAILLYEGKPSAEIAYDFVDALIADGQYWDAREVLRFLLCRSDVNVRLLATVASKESTGGDTTYELDEEREAFARAKLWLLDHERLDLPDWPCVRRPDAAAQAVRSISRSRGKLRDREATLQEALAQDLLCGAAWFELARLSQVRGWDYDALVEYTAAALFGHNPAEAWAEAAFLALSLYEEEISGYALECGMLTRDDRFLSRFRELVSEVADPELAVAFGEVVEGLEAAQLLFLPGPADKGDGDDVRSPRPAHERINPVWWGPLYIEPFGDAAVLIHTHWYEIELVLDEEDAATLRVVSPTKFEPGASLQLEDRTWDVVRVLDGDQDLDQRVVCRSATD